MQTNLSSELFTQHPIAWTLILSFLIGLMYAMRAIKKEKDVFIENPTLVEFGPYILKTPGWWSITSTTDSSIRFERTDTRYDWYAEFFLSDLTHESDVIEEFKEEIHKRSLLFDEDAGVIHQPLSMKKEALEHSDIARVEGTATQNGIERVYFDAMLAFDRDLNKRIWAESKSSVLNGLVEGPYFEYVIQNLKRI
ncbi:MAG: hypothetical protein CME71_13070 [Halobacteriovorax sp.]|nr:hypothetical protein [Halobacteriovorax sp.]|tara:strand:+ start:352 stop:936 length:585 start_codon:yes stop_codon:yes gene_type:complete